MASWFHYQAFSTCQYSSSTGVLRPKMFTVTFNLPRSGSTSSITPLKLRNGPLLIFTVSPTSKLTLGFSCSSEAEIWFLMDSTSSAGVGVGGSPPTKPMTPWVSLMKYQGFSMIRLFSSSKTMSMNTYPGQSLRVETVFFWFRTSTTFSIGTRTSLIYSPISSGLMRFSMLSLTFCSWPDRVWMTNHWLRMGLEFKEHEQAEEDLIHQDDKTAQDDDRDGHHDRRTLQLIPGRPGALAQLLPRLLHIVRQLQQISLAPENHEGDSDDRAPDPDFYQIIHDIIQFGGEGGIRTPVGG